MSWEEKYEGYSWILVKKAETVEVGGVKYVPEDHHIDETTFLINEVIKLARMLDDREKLLNEYYR